MLVFSQRASLLLSVGELRAHASRFFATKIGLMEDVEVPPVRVLVASDPRSGNRLVTARSATAADHARALSLEPANGIGLLASRCPTVWEVSDEEAEDSVALLIAAIFAGVYLGPIMTADAAFGVRTARSRLSL